MVALPLYCAVYQLIIPARKIMSANNQFIHQLILWTGENLSADPRPEITAEATVEVSLCRQASTMREATTSTTVHTQKRTTGTSHTLSPGLCNEINKR